MKSPSPHTHTSSTILLSYLDMVAICTCTCCPVHQSLCCCHGYPGSGMPSFQSGGNQATHDEYHSNTGGAELRVAGNTVIPGENVPTHSSDGTGTATHKHSGVSHLEWLTTCWGAPGVLCRLHALHTASDPHYLFNTQVINGTQLRWEMEMARHFSVFMYK